MRIRFDKLKSERLRKNLKRGIGFEEVQEIFQHPYFEDCRSDNPEQFRAIGWVKGKLFLVIYEVREDEEGDYYHFVTLWKSTPRRKNFMKKTYNKPTADKIADMADKGENISRYFTNKGKMKYPTQRVNVDFTVEMLKELDEMAAELNISRQAVIKSYLQQALDQHKLAKSKAS